MIFYIGLDATASNPRAVTEFIADTIRPSLLSSKIDLTHRVLTLNFSEAVNINSINLKLLTLQSDSDLSINSEFVTMSASDVTVLTNVTSIYELTQDKSNQG